MIWLEAALAFALIMLIFATMVSVIVEAGMRVFLARESGFQRMLEQMYDEMIGPRLTDLVDKSKVDSREDFIEKLSINPATPQATGLFAWLRKWTVPRKNTSMTVMQFADRLADTDVGREVAKQTRDHAEVLIKDMAQKFENVGASATAYYTRRAASISMIVAVLFAFAANVDSVRLVKTFIDNRQLTSSIIARTEEIQENHEERAEAMRKLLKDIKEAESGEVDEKKSVDLKDLRNTASQLQTELADLVSEGLPVTYAFFPACPVGSDDPKCEMYFEDLKAGICAKSSKSNKYGVKHLTLNDCLMSWHNWWGPISLDLPASLGWFLSVLLSGLLIGLGGPFWFDLASSLTKIVQLARTIGVGQKPKQKESAEEPAPMVQTTDQPRNPVEAFMTAAQAIGVSATARGRYPLSPSGEPLPESGQ